MLVSRSDNSKLSHWWFEVDKWLIVAIMALIGVGVLLSFAASTPVANRLGLTSYYFITRQLIFIGLAVVVMFGVSIMSERGVRRLATIGLPIFMLLVLLTIFVGPEIKGATRWLRVAGFTLQPSEFLKPCLIVFSAWMLAERFKNPLFPGGKISIVAFILSAALLVVQPDIGQTVLISIVFIIQLVLAGLPLIWIWGLGLAGIVGGLTAYFTIPHVTNRINAFLDPASADTFQTDTALNAFRAGGLVGRGPGEGAVKKVLPDAHTDFVFAVAGEEFGAIFTIAIILGFGIVVVRSLTKLLDEQNPFVIYAVGGLMSMFGLQAFINMGVNLAIIPNKGMTLPFISYGGSSLLALAISMGMVLALTRKNHYLTTRRFASGGGQSTSRSTRG
jgi:cell division protein FtsW